MVDRLHKKTQNVKLLLDPWIRALDSIFDHPNTIYPAVKSLSHPVHKEHPGAGLADKRLIILSEASTMIWEIEIYVSVYPQSAAAAPKTNTVDID